MDIRCTSIYVYLIFYFYLQKSFLLSFSVIEAFAECLNNLLIWKCDRTLLVVNFHENAYQVDCMRTKWICDFFLFTFVFMLLLFFFARPLVSLEDAVYADRRIIVYLFWVVVGIVSLSVSLLRMIRLHEITVTIYYKNRNCLLWISSPNKLKHLYNNCHFSRATKNGRKMSMRTWMSSTDRPINLKIKICSICVKMQVFSHLRKKSWEIDSNVFFFVFSLQRLVWLREKQMGNNRKINPRIYEKKPISHTTSLRQWQKKTGNRHSLVVSSIQ